MKLSRLLFVHSTEKIRVDTAGNHYTTGSLTSEVWPRYLSIADRVILCTHVDPVVYEPDFARRNFQPLPLEQIAIAELPTPPSHHLGQLHPGWRKARRRTIQRLVKESEGVIIRLPGGAGLVAVRVAMQQSRLHLVEVVGCTWDALWNHSLRGKVIAPFSFFATKRAIRNASNALYVTKHFLQARYPTLGNSTSCSDVALPRQDDSTRTQRLRRIRALETSPRCITIGTIAALDVRYKGHATVIRALAKLKKSGLRFHYVMAGGGDPSRLRDISKKLGVLDQVEFVGRLSHDAVFTYLDGIDVYVQPSFQEGLSRAMIEALSRGCAVFATMVGGNPELVDSNQLFKAGSATQLACLLSRLNTRQLETLATESFDRAKDFDARKLAEQRSRILRDFVANRETS